MKWPSRSKLIKIATTEDLETFDAKNESRICSVRGFRLGEKFFMQANSNGVNPWMGKISGRGFWFRDFKTYKEKFSEISVTQVPRFLKGEADELV